MIKAIIFDLDGMIHFSEERWSEWFSKKYDVPIENLNEFFNKEFKDCLIGKSDVKKEIRKYLTKWDLEFTAEFMLESWFSYGFTDKSMLLMISKLKSKGIKCVLCTNNERYRVKYFKDYHGFNSTFDAILASSDVGFKKPEKEMFEAIQKTVKVPKSKILFCDDDEKNILAAKKFGFKTHQYKKLKEFEEVVTNS